MFLKPTLVVEATRRWLGVAGGVRLALVVTALALPASSLAATLYVDAAASSAPPGTGCGSAAAYTQICAAPGPGIGTPCAPGSALASAIAGDIIEVCAGTYNENVEISLSNITLRGAKAGVPAGPDAVPSGRGSGESIIVGQTTSAIHLAVAGRTGIVIDGFTIQSGNFPAIHDNPNGLSGSHVWVNNIMVGSGTCSPALINLNRINDVEIRNNNLTGCQWGISVQSGNPADAPSLIEGNYFLDNSPSAGAVIMAANNAPGHVIRGNLVEGTGAGMILGCSDLELTDNTIQNRGTAFFLHSKATGATITGNELLNDTNGVRQSLAFGPYTLGTLNEVHYNNIVGSALFGARNELTPGDQDILATCNWWGSADGPFPTGSGDEVTAGVEFLPWLVAPAPDGACVGGLPCAIDDDCSDGVACNGAETCNTNTNTCEGGTPPACDGPCESGVCSEPAGCEPVPDGSELCDSGLDMCSVTDSCIAGACVNDGGGGDTDADGTCDLDDAALPLNVTKTLLKRNLNPAPPSGIAKVLGDFNVVPPQDLTGASVFEIEVTDGLGTSVSGTWGAAECTVRPSGAILCKSADRTRLVRFKKLGQTPGVYRFRVKMKKLDISDTALFEGPVTVRLTYDTNDRVGTILDCRATVRGLNCRE